MARKRKAASRAQRVAVGLGSALGSLQARLDRLTSRSAAGEIKKVIKRAESLLSRIGPNTSGDKKVKRVTKKAAKRSNKPGRNASAVTTASKARKKR